jgi:hypothetical protein
MKFYRGIRRNGACEVTVNDTPLPHRLDLKTLSSSGLEWGYDGGGPGQLALAILADHLGNDDLALSLYKNFRGDVIANLQQDEWTLNTNRIANALSSASHIVEVDMTLDQLLDKVRGK